MSTHGDPRDPSLEQPPTLPRKWNKDEFDILATSGMFLGGLIAVTRNQYIAWPALLVAINGIANRHPLRTKEGANSPWMTLVLTAFALLSCYLPYFTIPAKAQPAPPS